MEQTPPDPLAIIHITQAHNRGEISYEDWLKQTREVALAIIAYYTDDVSKSSNVSTHKKAS